MSRRQLNRLSPAEAKAALDSGAVMIDTRSDMERAMYGSIPGAHGIPFGILEARANPSSQNLDPAMPEVDREVIVICAHGVSSRVAAAKLQQLGYKQVTDVVGGFEAWQKAALPVEKGGQGFSLRRRSTEEPS